MPFESVVEDVSGGNEKVQKGDYRPTGLYPIVDQGQEFVGGFCDDEGNLVQSEGPWIVFGDHTRALKFVDFPFCMGADGVKVLRPRLEQSVDPKYLYHFLNANPVPSAGYSRHYKFLKRLNIPLPPLKEQRRIAAILDKADALRRKRKHALELLDSLAQSIFVEMFGDPIHSNGPKTTVVKVAISTQIGPFGSLLHREDYCAGGIPLINPMHIDGGSLKPSAEFAVSLEKFRELKAYHLSRGDVVMGRRGEMGRCAEVVSSEKLLCGTGSLFIRPDQEKILPTFLQALLSSGPAVAYLERSAAGVTMANLNKGVVDNLTFTLPSLASQAQFAAAREAVVRHRELTTVMSAEADLLFTSLQHRAFSGQL